MTDLKPCPFCGGDAQIERPGTHRQSMIIACTDCGCRMESGDVLGLTNTNDLRWNTRTASVPVEALRELDKWFDFTNPEGTRRELRLLIDQAERREGGDD